MTEPQSLLSQVAGMSQVRRVHKIFHDKILDFPAPPGRAVGQPLIEKPAKG